MLNHSNTQSTNSRSVSAQARFLMSQRRQRQQNRSQTMLQRAAAEVGLDN
ncbi:MAG: hypothetical protein ACFB4I_23370 [Cyanophyceae cyanobacterium]